MPRQIMRAVPAASGSAFPALDLSTSNNAEKEQINALKACASDSRFRKDSSNPSKAAKLYWNATGSSLADKFKEIANELSNLRIVG
jgi:hypothetical protein